MLYTLHRVHSYYFTDPTLAIRSVATVDNSFSIVNALIILTPDCETTEFPLFLHLPRSLRDVHSSFRYFPCSSSIVFSLSRKLDGLILIRGKYCLALLLLISAYSEGNVIV